MLSRNPPTARQRVEAALMHTDGLGVVTGFEAARRYGLKNTLAEQIVHILIPDRNQIRSAKFTIVERTIHMPEKRLIDGVPLATPARAVLDAARRIRDIDPVRAILIEAVSSGLCTIEELSAELESGSKRGTALPRSVLREISSNVKSVPEAVALSVWKRAGLPPAERNVKIYDAQGNYIAMPDSYCEEVAMAWEIDSYDFHFEKAAYAKTIRRNGRYTAAGVVVLQTLPSQLRDDPDAVVTELRAAFHTASRRPRPDIRVVRDRRAA